METDNTIIGYLCWIKESTIYQEFVGENHLITDLPVYRGGNRDRGSLVSGQHIEWKTRGEWKDEGFNLA